MPDGKVGFLSYCKINFYYIDVLFQCQVGATESTFKISEDHSPAICRAAPRLMKGKLSHQEHVTKHSLFLLSAPARQK